MQRGGGVGGSVAVMWHCRNGKWVEEWQTTTGSGDYGISRKRRGRRVHLHTQISEKSNKKTHKSSVVAGDEENIGP